MHNNAIVQAAWRAARGELPGLPREPGRCLQLVRIVLEAALFDGRVELYGRYLVAGAEVRGGSEPSRRARALVDPWAVDMEQSAQQLGWALPLEDRQAGDLVFNAAAAPPYGHVGVLLDRDTVLENIDPRYRKGSVLLPESLALTPVSSLPWTTAARVGGAQPHPNASENPQERGTIVLHDLSREDAATVFGAVANSQPAVLRGRWRLTDRPPKTDLRRLA